MFCEQLVLECPDDILAFEFCPSDPNIIVGGCINGQVNETLNEQIKCYPVIIFIHF